MPLTTHQGCIEVFSSPHRSTTWDDATCSCTYLGLEQLYVKTLVSWPSLWHVIAHTLGFEQLYAETMVAWPPIWGYMQLYIPRGDLIQKVNNGQRDKLVRLYMLEQLELMDCITGACMRDCVRGWQNHNACTGKLCMDCCYCFWHCSQIHGPLSQGQCSNVLHCCCLPQTLTLLENEHIHSSIWNDVLLSDTHSLNFRGPYSAAQNRSA